MGVQFTKEQQQAIDTLDKSILVSAAAGSGKTAVLVQRIIHIILEGKANVDEMLVVTFTNAAATEMKLKLTTAIRKHMRENPESAPLMNQQLNKMYQSYITTFHSFALRLIREFFYRIDREPTFKICDEAQGQLLQLEAIDELFEECFENDSYVEGGSFRDFLEHYSSDRSEDTIKSAMLEIYGKLRSMPDYFEWAYKRAEMLRMPESGKISDSPIFEPLMNQMKNKVTEAQKKCEELISLLDTNGVESLLEIAEQDYNAIEDYKNQLDQLIAKHENDEISAWKYDFKRFSAKKADKDAYDPIKEDASALRDDYKKALKSIAEQYAGEELEARFREMDATYSYTIYYLNLLRDFEHRFDEKKKAADLVDFGDIEHFAVEILKDPEVCRILRNRFQFIFIDEYQDTNKIQEHIISRIARPDNQFKVGDVKQSIYGFRQSDPKIFMATRKKFESEDCPDAIVIDLNRNFRSNGATIDYINDVFEGIMPGYDDKAKLYQGLPSDSEYNLMPEVHILTVPPKNSASDSESDESEEESLSNVEGEAVYIAQLVKNIIGTTFHDGKTGVRRVATPRDIVILCRSTKSSADVYYKAMLEQDIPTHVNDDTGYFDTVEIHLAISLLQVLNNGHQDIPLIAVLRSEIFGFTPEELAEIRIAYREEGKRGSYYKAYAYCLEHPQKIREELYQKLKCADDNLKEWRYHANKMPLDEYIWYVLTDSGYYLYSGAMYGGRQRQANLRVLTEKARKYQETGIASLSGFIRYVNILRQKNVKTGQAAMIGEDADVVRIMTMHKSKGLEFPFVIVAGMGNRGNRTSLGKGLTFDSDIGVGISYVNREEKYWRSTILQTLIKEKINEEELQEERRILYVALTRAREKLILVGRATIKDEEDSNNFSFEKTSSYYDIQEKLNIPSVKHHIAPFPTAKQTRKRNLFEEFEKKRGNLDVRKASEYELAVAERLNYEYPNTDGLKTKAKYTVSELRYLRAEGTTNSENQLAKMTVLENLNVSDGHTISGADIGTAYHRIMETLDFVRVAEHDMTINEDYIEQVMNRLNESQAISDDVFATLNRNVIADFFRTTLGIRALRAAQNGKLWKEKPFTLRTEVEGKQVMVQGVIDCFFEEDGKLVLVDYKSNHVDKDISPIADMYREQIRLYRQALEMACDESVGDAYLYLLRTGDTIPM
jgi:ATP-dependent helicase/nuclease subunit A